MNKFLFTAIVIIGCVLSATIDVFTNQTQPPEGRTNAPNEQNCADGCHNDGNNPYAFSDSITFSYNNNNKSYTPNGPAVAIILGNIGQNASKFGFEATALTTSNSKAGSFTSLSPNTVVRTQGLREYISHNNASGVATWVFNYTPPATNVGDIIFYVATNAANGDFTNQGDRIFLDTFIIRAPAVSPPSANFTANNSSVCQNGTVTFTDASSNDVTTWSWNFGAGASPATANTKGPHTVTYTTSGSKNVSLTVNAPGGNDTETKTAFVNVNALPVAIAGNNVTICSGGLTTLNASGGISYQWSPAASLSNANIANPSAFPTVTTTYTVTVTDMNTCSATSQVTVTVNNVSANAGNDVTVCPGNSTQLNATGGTTYSWSPAAGLSATNIANPVATPTVTTIYSVTVTGPAGCTATDEVLVDIGSTLTVDAGPNDTICRGETLQLNATGGTDYTWSPAAGLSAANIANPVASPTITTTYTVTVTSGNCTATDNVTINVYQVPNVTLTTSGTTGCVPHTVTFNNTTPNVVSCNWNFGDGGSSGVCSPAPYTYTQSGNFTATLTITDANGCTASRIQAINVNPKPNANAGSNVTICTGGTVQLTATGGSTYLWSTGATTAIITQSPTTDSTYRVTVTSANGCTASDDVMVTVSSTLGISISNDTTVCAGSAVELLASGGNSFIWSPATGLSAVNIPNPVATPTDTTTYKVIVTDGVCTDSTTVTINVNGEVNAAAGPDTLICQGATVQLFASGGISYSWSPPVGLSNPNIANPVLSSGSGSVNYVVTVSDGICTNTDTVAISVTPTLQTTITDDTTFIINSGTPTLPLLATGGTTYSWQPTAGLSNPNIANPVFNPFAISLTSDTMITYTVTISDGACTATESVTIDIQFIVGIENVLPANEIKVFPNPASTELNFVNAGNNEIHSVEIYNLTGVRVMELKTGNASQQTVNISSLAEGSYLIRFLFSDSAIHKMIQVK